MLAVHAGCIRVELEISTVGETFQNKAHSCVNASSLQGPDSTRSTPLWTSTTLLLFDFHGLNKEDIIRYK